jgi:tetratricopeptide (TPR) repeat protein
MPTSSTGSIREFGGEKLVASGEDEAMAARQAAYFLGVVNAAEHEWRRSRQVAVLQEAQREHDNLRAAWHWAEDRGEPSLAQELAKALEWLAGAELDLFQVRSAVADYERLLAQARERGDRPRELDALLGLAQAHYVLALDNQIAGAPERARDLYQQAEACARTIGDAASIVRVLVRSILLTDFFPDDYPRAAAQALEAWALSAGLADEDLVLDSRMAACC